MSTGATAGAVRVVPHFSGGAMVKDGSDKNRRQERKKASAEAVANRRLNRRALTESRWRRYQEKQQRDREVAVRMTTRFFPKEQIRLHWLDLRYWQLRRTGYDIDSRAVRFAGYKRDGSEILLEPMDTPHWKWWITKPDESRRHFVKVSKFRLLRQSENDRIVLHLMGYRQSDN